MSGAPLRVEGLHFSYGKNKVLRGVDFQLPAGEITVLLGANGAGKSTLFRCLVALLKSASGAVWLGETDVLKLDVAQRLKRVCYIPQAFAVSARLTVFETVLLAREQAVPHEERPQALATVERVLEMTGLTSLSESNLNELSGGQQQRVGTAQALSQNPEALLMDEPTSALDLRYQLETLQLIQRFTRERNITTLIALHDINLAARFADSILLLEAGQVVLHASPASALTSPELERAYSVQLERAQTASGIPMVAAKLRGLASYLQEG